MFDFGLTVQQEERARKLHEECTIVDMLSASALTDDVFRLMKQGGTTAVSHTISQGGAMWSPVRAYEAVMTRLAEWSEIFRRRSDEVMHVTSMRDVVRAKAEGKLGVILNFQDTLCLGENIDRLDLFKKMGVWVIQLTYNYQGLVGSGCLERGNYGLSEFGVKVVHRMNELGIVVDTGHCNDATMMDAIKVSKKPIACTHTNLRALCDTPRCHSDEALKELASKGGVVGLTTIPGFMSETARCTVNDYLNQIDYAVKLVGIDHVGIGTDVCTGKAPDLVFDGLDWGENGRRLEEVHIYRGLWPCQLTHEGLEDESKLVNLTRGLVSRGYKDNEIAKILGGNWTRLLEEVNGKNRELGIFVGQNA